MPKSNRGVRTATMRRSAEEVNPSALDCSTAKFVQNSTSDLRQTNSFKQSNTIKVLQINPKRILTGARASLPNKQARTSDNVSGNIENEYKLQIRSSSDINCNGIKVEAEDKSIESNPHDYEKVVKITQTKLLIDDDSTSVIKRPSSSSKVINVVPKRPSSFNVADITRESPTNGSPIKVIRSTNETNGINRFCVPCSKNSNTSQSVNDETADQLAFSFQLHPTEVSTSTEKENPLERRSTSQELVSQNDTSPYIAESPSASVITHFSSQIPKVEGPAHLPSFSPDEASSTKNLVPDFKGFKTCNVFMGAPSASTLSLSDGGSINHRHNESPLSSDPGEVNRQASPQNMPVDYSALAARTDVTTRFEPMDESHTVNGTLAECSTASTLPVTIPTGSLGIKIGNYETNVSIGDADGKLMSLGDVGAIGIAADGSNASAFEECSSKLPSIESAFSRVADSFRYPKDPSPSYATLK